MARILHMREYPTDLPQEVYDKHEVLTANTPLKLLL